MEVIAGKGGTFVSPDKLYSQSRRLSRRVNPRTCWHDSVYCACCRAKSV